MKNFLVVAVVLLFGQFALAEFIPSPPVLKSVAISHAYIPMGFDSNDNVQLIVEGALTTTCYRASSVKINVNDEAKVISLLQMAYVYGGPCHDMLVPYNTVVSVGMLGAHPGYRVVDGFSGRFLGVLPVKQSFNSGPDDYLYAPISDAVIRPGAVGGYFVVVHGVFMNSCAKLNELRVTVQKENRVLIVLPLSTLANDSGCTPGYYRFSKEFLLPEVETARYLLHVRSLNGQAINKLVDLAR